MSTPAINPAEARVQSLSNPCYQAANISDNNFEDWVKCQSCTVYRPVTPVNSTFRDLKQAVSRRRTLPTEQPFYYDEALKY